MSVATLTATPDQTSATFTAHDPALSWEACHAAFQAARAANRAACKARTQAAAELGDEALTAFPHVWHHPKVAPLSRAEQETEKQVKAARDAFLDVPAPDWLSFAAKFEVVREYLDNILDPLDPRDFKRAEKDFPGTRAAAQVHHMALAAHHGVLRPDRLRAIPKLMVKMARKSGEAPDLSDPTQLADMANGTDGVLRGLASAYADALRLVTGATGISTPRTASAVEPPPPSFLEGLLAESDRIDSLSCGLPNATHQPVIDRLDKASGILHREFMDAPVTTPADAVTKLNWVKKGFVDGETGHEPAIIDQVIGFLTAPAPASAPTGTCHAEVVAHELCEILCAELEATSTAAQSALTDRRDEYSTTLAKMTATSRQGAIAQAAVALEYSDLMRGCANQEDRDHYHDQIENLMRSALRVLVPDMPPVMWEAYVGQDQIKAPAAAA